MSKEFENKDKENVETTNYENEGNDEQVLETLSVKELLAEMENIINKEDSAVYSKKFHQLRNFAHDLIQEEIADKKHDFVEKGNEPEEFSYQHPEQSRYSALVNIFKEKLDILNQNLEKHQQQN